MDNLETLFNKKQYDLVVKLTEESVDPKERFMRLTSLVILGKDNEALDEIENNQAMFDKAYPNKVMRLHFELLFKNRMFDEAKIALKHYQDLPYISQEVEEFLHEVPNEIESLSKAKNKGLPVEELCDRLEKETDGDLLLEALAYIKVYNINSIIDSIKVFLLRKEVRQDLRAFALFALMEQDYSKKLPYLSIDGMVEVVPSDLKTPFENKSFLDIAKLIDEKSLHNVTLKETASNLFASYVIDTYPSDIYSDGVNAIADAFISIAKDYIQEPSDNLSNEVLSLKKKILSIIEHK